MTNLVVLDYSGTLSIDITMFGRTDILIKALKRSGLWNLGVENEGIFWGQIVNPTWTEGSLTQIGYKALIVA
ncbi:MAG: hypothetical protein K8L97_30120 [Anaerolineae bacterium]|nr:hypothetical protein [Anaerolineae bacterium]